MKVVAAQPFAPLGWKAATSIKIALDPLPVSLAVILGIERHSFVEPAGMLSAIERVLAFGVAPVLRRRGGRDLLCRWRRRILVEHVAPHPFERRPVRGIGGG
jgi:hypothetical protein